jgi:hypothetical protein
MTPLHDFQAAIDIIARTLAPYIARELAPLLAAGRLDDLVDQRDSALAELRISARVYLQGARAKEFASNRRGRLIVARRRDVEAWLQRRSEKPAIAEKTASKPLSLRDEVRASLGLVPNPAKLQAVPNKLPPPLTRDGQRDDAASRLPGSRPRARSGRAPRIASKIDRLERGK